MAADRLPSPTPTLPSQAVHIMVDDLTPDYSSDSAVPGGQRAAWVGRHLTLALRVPLLRSSSGGLPYFCQPLKDNVRDQAIG